MANLFPVNGDLEGAYMKQIKLFFLILILCICIFGCDEGMIDPMQLVDIVSQYETTVQTELPDDVLAAMKIQADLLSNSVHRQIHGEQHISELTTPEQVQIWNEQRQWLIDNGYDKIDFHELQKAYYTKYIDAAGIAIVAPQHTRTKYLIDARDAIVVMTSKHPELRERFQSKLRMFYMVLIPDFWELGEMPETLLNYSKLDDDPKDDFNANSCGFMSGPVAPPVGLCWASVNIETSSARIFVHEFAHAIDYEMNLLQPGFWDKRKEYYANVPDDPSNEIFLPDYEYWARAVEAWFYQKKPGGYEEYIEEKGYVGEMLDYWFPRVSLGNDERGFSLGERQADGAWVLVPDAEDILQDKIVQAQNIIKKHCFECHGENGTHKDVLLMDNQLELWDAGIINPGDPDSSILFRRILGHPAYGPQMPLGKPPFSEEEIDIIEIWISYFRGKIRFPSGVIIPF